MRARKASRLMLGSSVKHVSGGLLTDTMKYFQRKSGTIRYIKMISLRFNEISRIDDFGGENMRVERGG
jgi:hypothetical protein